MHIFRNTALIALLALCGPAFAQTQVFTRGALNGNDFVDWSVVGADLASVADGATFTSNGGRTGKVHSGTGDPMLRVNQGTNYFGDFTSGDALLQTANPQTISGPLTILFDQAVSGVGAQLQPNVSGDFTGFIDLLGADFSTVLSTFDVTGVSEDRNDGSAPFLGALSNTANIHGVRFRASTTQDILINRLDLRVAPTTGGNNGGGGQNGGAPVPEPGEWAAMGVLGAGLAGLVVRGRRHRAA